nr:uncharacterized protein LOC109175786 [Ipomoea trifida]GMD74475.1 uncharacterized protein LOC109175786 [Ipomoea batatas]GMD77751.1 uncharacterized protein LOC109175786 [Ipomoea batatas]GME17745.1 uncharacterized protein LOC109175786 [Ipomoea batatas]GME20179.1 uncharacterized protein LOC109175786 [Ipomoea batatas]
MNSKKPSIRAVGQRSIPSTFLFRPSIRSNGSNEDVEIKNPSEKCPKISLSDFLNKKLHKSSVLSGSVQRKEKQFLSPVGSKDAIRFPKENGNSKGKDVGEHCALDVILEKLKRPDKGEEHGNRGSGCDEAVISSTEGTEISKKRRNVFEGNDEEQSGRKVLVVLGGDSKNKQSRKGKSRATVEKPANYFNHYANGGGWWDYEREGVDNEEVGCNEMWEGRGCTTLGGLDWH